MSEKDILKELNGIEYSSEYKEKLNSFNEVSIEELKLKSANLKSKLSQSYFEKQKEMVKELLEKGEEIDYYVKGANIEMLRTMIAFGRGLTFKSNDIPFNYSIFVTNKRIFIGDSNYYDEANGFTVYNLDEIKEVERDKVGYKVDREVKKRRRQVMKFGVSPAVNFFILFRYSFGFIVSLVILTNTLFMWYNNYIRRGYVVGDDGKRYFDGFYDLMQASDAMTTGDNIIFSLIAAIIIWGIVRLVKYLTRSKLRISMKLKENDYLDFIVVNEDGEEIAKKLQSLSNNNK